MYCVNVTILYYERECDNCDRHMAFLLGAFTVWVVTLLNWMTLFVRDLNYILD